MSTIPQNKRYLPHDLNTRYYAVKLYRQVKDINHVIRRYHISKASLMRWNKLFNGSKESLISKSHRPLSPHPNAHTPLEIKWISDYHRRNPHISIVELYGKLRKDKGYSRHPLSLYRVFIRLGFSDANIEKREKYKPKPYDTPESPGVKWQMDVKYVPTCCYSGNDGQKFYQYTVIDEATRQRFIYPYMEQSSYSTVDFIKKAIRYFGYKPQMIQTDNGAEFTHLSKTDRVHPMDILCEELGIMHKLIRPRTPRHNGKVERSHRNDQQRFYNFLNFYSYGDLILQMKRYLYRSNNIPMSILGWMSPVEKRHSLLN